MKLTYLSLPVSSNPGAGMIGGRNDTGAVMGVFHSLEQGCALMEQLGISSEEGGGYYAEMTNAAFAKTGPSEPIWIPPSAAAWLESILVETPQTVAYGEQTPERLCFFDSFQNGKDQSGMAAYYLKGPCEVVFFRSQEQGDAVLNLYSHVTEHSLRNGPAIDEIYGRLPQESSAPTILLTGNVAEILCASIEYTGRLAPLITSIVPGTNSAVARRGFHRRSSTRH